MQLTFLGTSSGTPTRQRNVTACALTRDDGRVWLVDCGEGTQHRMLASSLRPSQVDAVFITHLHGDHCYGLFGLLSSLAVHQRGTAPLPIVGPTGIHELVDTVLRLSEAHLPFPLDIRELDPRRGHDFALQGWAVAARPLVHRVPCLGYAFQEPPAPGRFDAERAAALGIGGPERGRLVRGERITTSDGMVIGPDMLLGPPRPGRRAVILGDTSDSSAMADAAADCDVLVQEATYEQSRHEKALAWGHSTATMAGDFAAQVGAAHLVLTHFSSRYTAPGADPAVDHLVAEAAARCPLTTVHAADDHRRLVIHRREDDHHRTTVEWNEDHR